MNNSIRKGTLHGIWIWVAYGIIEFVFAFTLPDFFWKPWMQIAPWQWSLIASLFGVYAVTGALLGAFAGALLTWSGRDRMPGAHRIAAGLSLAAVFIFNLLSAPHLPRTEQLAIAAAVAICVFLAAGLTKDAWNRRTAFLTNPFVVSALLLSGSWASQEALFGRSSVVKLLGAICAVAVVAGLARLYFGISPGGWFAQRKAAAAISIAIAIVTGTLAVGIAAHAGDDQPSPAPGPVNLHKPNILLITMDTVRADHLSLYGYSRETTPRLREFAREAAVYDRAVAASSYTLPTHASIFTGQYPAWHGAYPTEPDFRGGRPLDPSAITLAETLRDHGYRTAAVVANTIFLGASTGLSQGFTDWTAKMSVRVTDQQRPYYIRESARRLLKRFVDTADYDACFLRASDVNSAALSLLEKQRTRPFFLFLNYMDAHHPYLPPSDFRKRFGATWDTHDAAYYLTLRNQSFAAKQQIREEDRRALMARYDAGISYEDAEIGRLLESLRKMGLYENTMIVITGDHGEAIGEHGLVQHGIVSSVQEEFVHVPLLIKYPGHNEARRSAELVSQVDLMPTILAAAGYPAAQTIQGRDLRAAPSGEPIFASALSYEMEVHPRWKGIRYAIYGGSWKLVTWTGGPPQLFDLASDPTELQNRYRDGDPVAADLLARLKAWVVKMPPTLSKPKEIDRTTLDRMKSLGYIQ